MTVSSIGGAWTIWLIVAPLVAALLAFLVPRAASLVVFANMGVTAFASLALLQVVRVEPVRYELGGWPAPLGINLYADTLSGLLLLVAAIVILAVALYSRPYVLRNGLSVLYWPIVMFLQAALNALLVSADVFNLYVTLELLCLSAVALVALAGGRSATRAALRYLLASIVASLFYLLGVALMYHTFGVLDIALLAGRTQPGPPLWAALGLMTAGLVLKGALFPAHFWLPQAHACAPSPVSAVLSALVIKAPFYVLLRLWYAPFAGAPGVVAELLGVLGAAAIVWGSVQALRQERLKLLVAYSTVAQIGYLFLLFPLAQHRSAVQGVTVFIIGHALAKAGMFLAAGNIQTRLGHDRIRELHRVARDMPVTLAAFGIAGVCIMGLPPSANFMGKWLLAEAAFAQGDWVWAVVVVAGGLLSAAYVFRVLGYAFTVAPGAGGTKRTPAVMSWSAFLLAVLALVLGLVAAPLVDQVGAPTEGVQISHAEPTL